MLIVRRRRPRTVLAALAAVLPRRLARVVHRRLLGYDIDPEASVGHAFIDVDRLRMEPGASIGSLTVIRGCEDVELAPEATIAPLVWVNSVRREGRYFRGLDRHPALLLGRGAFIGYLHIVDACDAVTLGDFSELGGFRSLVMTHSLDMVRMRQSTQPVTLGHHCMVGTSVVLLPGTTVPDCSVVAAGSVLSPTGVQDGGHYLYSGVPAQVERELNPRIKFFHHTTSDVL